MAIRVDLQHNVDVVWRPGQTSETLDDQMEVPDQQRLVPDQSEESINCVDQSEESINSVDQSETGIVPGEGGAVVGPGGDLTHLQP